MATGGRSSVFCGLGSVLRLLWPEVGIQGIEGDRYLGSRLLREKGLDVKRDGALLIRGITL